MNIFSEGLWDTIVQKYHLTPRQRQVLFFMAKGYGGKEIASLLDVSPKTIETFKMQLCQRVGVKRAPQLYAAVFTALVETYEQVRDAWR